MKKTAKRTLSLLVCLVLLTALLPLPAAASAKVLDSGTCGSNVRWALTDDGTLTISGSGKLAALEMLFRNNQSEDWFAHKRFTLHIGSVDGSTAA